jgi:hypothetical protein
MNFGLERRGTATFVVAAVVACSWVASGLRPFTPSEEVLVAIPALLALLLSTRTSRTTGTGSVDASSRASAAIWLAFVVVAAAWEFNAFFASPRSAHPTLSVIADAVMSVRPGRALVFVLWLALGWVLVRGSRAVHP